MMEHGGGSLFCNSCVKVPVDPCSGYPTPSYERPSVADKDRRKIAFAMTDRTSESSSPRESLDNFLDFLESIPDYGQVHHLSNEQFKQKLEYLKRKQRLFLKSLQNTSNEEDSPKEDCCKASSRTSQTSRASHGKCDVIERNGSTDLKLNGKKCYLEESRVNSPLLFPSNSFSGLTDDQDLITYRCREKEEKTMRNEEEMLSAKGRWYASKPDDNDVDEDTDESVETRSLPAEKEWHPTVPKPFNFMLREEGEKYMTFAEKGVVKMDEKPFKEGVKNTTRQRRVRPIPLTSKIPLYDKLLAEKEERSRMVREESAFNLMSQVRPFKLECDRRAWKSMTRSSPAICSAVSSTKSRFRAKPVPKNLFATDVYDRMLEDEYFRQIKKRVRAAELMKSSSLPPSMAIRERIKSATSKRRTTREILADGSTDTSSLSNQLPPSSERSSSAMNLLPSGGSNLAAILRCQASRQKLEQEMREKMEEKRREQEMKLRESLIGRKPAWRALRSAARHEHERDLDIRASLRRDEAREQAERHRLQMEMMLDRVTQIPTLFERHSQSAKDDRSKSLSKHAQRKGKKKVKRRNGSSVDSYASYGSGSRPDSGSLTSSSGNSPSFERSSKSSSSKESERSLSKSGSTSSKKKSDRGPLKVSINETAELIDDVNE